MVSFTRKISFALLFLLSVMSFNGSICSGSSGIRCHQNDRRLLQIFREGVNDSYNLLSSWSAEEDCCAWQGVHCDNITGRVTRLDLRCQNYTECLEGEIDLSLFELEFLNYLDLSSNDFETIRYPSIHSQRYHNQSLATSSLLYANFSAGLHYLDFSYNYDLHMDNLHWLSLVPSLRYLNLSGIDLHNQTNWLQSVAVLPSILELRLNDCNLTNIHPSLKYVNFTSLVTLDLSRNYFESEIPDWLFYLNSVVSHVYLRSNSFRGQIPESLLNLRSLKILDLSRNNLNGSIPDWLGQLQHLQDLDLSRNLLSGPIPSSLGNLSLVGLDVRFNGLTGNLPEWLGQQSKLESLLVGGNPLTGILSETFFNGLSNLKELDLGNTSIAHDLGPNWAPPFQLQILHLRGLPLGPNFPSWIYTQRSIMNLDISGTGISSVNKDKFWNLAAKSGYLDVSNNSINGDLSDVLLSGRVVVLAFNNFKGGLPHISENVEVLDLSHNSFSGSLFPLLCHTGKRENMLFYLDISNNLLSGEIPDCWANWENLHFIHLGSNQLTGELSSMGSLLHPAFIDLHNNSFSGRIPILRNGTAVLELSSNKLTGEIPSELCQLSSLDILDLANNKLSGPIPQCIYNITSMATSDIYYATHYAFKIDEKYWYKMQVFKLTLNIKGHELEYFDNDIVFIRFIDLSSNHLTGVIPPELFELTALEYLNLSHNHLMGKIPMDIGGMKNLESLDLSDNKLSGEIPQSISNLNFLSYINLSYNDFYGKIPPGPQLQTFEGWSYIGNPQLCGPPLSKNCTEENPIVEEHDGSGRESWFYLGMGVGFAVGFWAVCGAIFLNKAFSHAYFQLLDRVADKIYGVAALKFNMFR